MITIKVNMAVKRFINKAARLTGGRGIVTFELASGWLIMSCRHEGILLCYIEIHMVWRCLNGTIFAVPVRRLRELFKKKDKEAAIMVYDGATLHVTFGGELPENSPLYNEVAWILGGEGAKDTIGDIRIRETHNISTIKATPVFREQGLAEIFGILADWSKECFISSNHMEEWFSKIKTLSIIGGSIGFGRDKYFSAQEVRELSIFRAVKEIAPVHINKRKDGLFCREFSLLTSTSLALTGLLNTKDMVKYRFIGKNKLVFSQMGLFVVVNTDKYADITRNYQTNVSPEDCQRLAMKSSDFRAILESLARGSVGEKQKVRIAACRGRLMFKAKSEEGESLVDSAPYKCKKNMPNFTGENFTYDIKYGELLKIAKYHAGKVMEFSLYEKDLISSMSIHNERREVTIEYMCDSNIQSDEFSNEVPERAKKTGESVSVIDINKYRKERAV